MVNGNIFVDNGRKIIMHRAFEDSSGYTKPNMFKVGTGTTIPLVTDTVLATPILISGSPTKSLNVGYPVFDDSSNQVTNRGMLTTVDCNGESITEFGLVNTDGTPQLFSRCVFTPVTKTSTVQLIFVEKDMFI